MTQVRKDAESKLADGENRLGEARAEGEKRVREMQGVVTDLKREMTSQLMDARSELERVHGELASRLVGTDARRDELAAELESTRRQVDATLRTQADAEIKYASELAQVRGCDVLLAVVFSVPLSAKCVLPGCLSVQPGASKW